jgi:hypothetical protein
MTTTLLLLKKALLHGLLLLAVLRVFLFPCEWEIDHFQVIMAVIDQIPPGTQAQHKKKNLIIPSKFLLGSFYTAGIHD